MSTNDLSCRECGRRAAETGTPVFAGAVAFTCSSCITTSTDFPPSCRRCLGAHWDAECEYNLTEARAAHGARSAAESVTRNSEAPNQDVVPAPPSEASSESKIPEAANAESTTSNTPQMNKASRRGRPRVDPTLKRAGAAARQRAYRERHRVASEQSSRLRTS